MTTAPGATPPSRALQDELAALESQVEIADRKRREGDRTHDPDGAERTAATPEATPSTPPSEAQR